MPSSGADGLPVTHLTSRDAMPRPAADGDATWWTMLESMRHGVASFGPDRRLRAANSPAERLAGLPGRLVPGRLFDELVAEHRAATGGSAREQAESLAMDRGRPLAYVRRGIGGMVLGVASDPTPDGGFVLTYSDLGTRPSVQPATTAQVAAAVVLDHIRHGIALYDADRRLIAANALFGRTTGLPTELLVPGSRLRDLLEAQAAHGNFGPHPQAAAAKVADMLDLDRRMPYREQRRLPDGRVLDVTVDPTPDGGLIITHNDVTALVQAEADARARAALLHATLDHIHHSIVLYGPDRRVVLANRHAAAAHGVPRLDARQGTALDVLVAEQLAGGYFGEGPEAARLAAGVVAMDRRVRQQYERVLPDGRILSIASDPLPDGGFVVTGTDVTALREAEAVAARRAEVLAVMLDNMRHGICLFDAAGRIVAANDLALRMTGLEAADLAPGVTVADLADAQRIRGEFPEAGDWRHEAGATGPLRVTPYRRTRPDGTVVEVLTARTPDGDFVRSFTDVTPLVAAEAEARRRADQQQAMLDNIRHGIMLVDRERRIVAANPMLRHLLDVSEGVVAPGRSFAAFAESLRAGDRLGTDAVTVRRTRELPTQDPQRSFRLEWAGPSGRMFEVVSEPTPDDGFVLTFTDITEDRRIRAELEGARDAAEAADRAKSRFLATMSHELRTPLNAVIGFSDAIRADPLAPGNAEYAGAIREAGRHLLSLIDDLLDVARTETFGLDLQEAPSDLGEVAAAAIRVMGAAAASGGVTLSLDWPPGLPLVRADALRIRQVLLNLLSNAVKFTPAGGAVRVGATVCDEQGMELTVTDTGIGIAPADLGRAFQPFIQLDNALSRRFPGSGLGLYLSRALAAAHGAELTLDSTPGHGTTARLRFPVERLVTPG